MTAKGSKGVEEKIRKLIESIVRERFPDAKILSVSIQDPSEYDEDDFIRVLVVFESKSGVLDAAATSGIVRHVRPKLHELGEDRFPIMSFIAASEMKKGARSEPA